MKKSYKTYIIRVGLLAAMGTVFSYSIAKNKTMPNKQKEDTEQEIEKVVMEETEWKETLTAGWNRLWNDMETGFAKTEIKEYGAGDSCSKIINSLS